MGPAQRVLFVSQLHTKGFGVPSPPGIAGSLPRSNKQTGSPPLGPAKRAPRRQGQGSAGERAARAGSGEGRPGPGASGRDKDREGGEGGLEPATSKAPRAGAAPAGARGLPAASGDSCALRFCSWVLSSRRGLRRELLAILGTRARPRAAVSVSRAPRPGHGLTVPPDSVRTLGARGRSPAPAAAIPTGQEGLPFVLFAPGEAARRLHAGRRAALGLRSPGGGRRWAGTRGRRGPDPKPPSRPPPLPGLQPPPPAPPQAAAIGLAGLEQETQRTRQRAGASRRVEERRPARFGKNRTSDRWDAGLLPGLAGSVPRAAAPTLRGSRAPESGVPGVCLASSRRTKTTRRRFGRPRARSTLSARPSGAVSQRAGAVGPAGWDGARGAPGRGRLGRRRRTRSLRNGRARPRGRGPRAGAAREPTPPGRTRPQTPPGRPWPEPHALPGTHAAKTPRCAGLVPPFPVLGTPASQEKNF